MNIFGLHLFDELILDMSIQRLTGILANITNLSVTRLPDVGELARWQIDGLMGQPVVLVTALPVIQGVRVMLYGDVPLEWFEEDGSEDSPWVPAPWIIRQIVNELNNDDSNEKNKLVQQELKAKRYKVQRRTIELWEKLAPRLKMGLSSSTICELETVAESTLGENIRKMKDKGYWRDKIEPYLENP